MRQRVAVWAHRGPPVMRVGMEADALLEELGIAAPSLADRERAVHAWFDAVCAVSLDRAPVDGVWNVREGGAVVGSASGRDNADALLRARRFEHALERLRRPRGTT